MHEKASFRAVGLIDVFQILYLSRQRNLLQQRKKLPRSQQKGRPCPLFVQSAPAFGSFRRYHFQPTDSVSNVISVVTSEIHSHQWCSSAVPVSHHSSWNCSCREYEFQFSFQFPEVKGKLKPCLPFVSIHHKTARKSAL